VAGMIFWLVESTGFHQDDRNPTRIGGALIRPQKGNIQNVEKTVPENQVFF
jgi:hypothetical protein